MSICVYDSPLRWPEGMPRTKVPQASNFFASPDKIRKEFENALRRLEARSIVVSSNMRVRQDGKPYASERGYLFDAGAAVYFQLGDKPHCIACDRWLNVFDNLRAITLTMEALRGIERWGSTEMRDRSFQGFQALPPPAEPWYIVLQVSETAPLEVVEASYKALSRKAHPDNGGSTDAMARLNRAIEQARAVLS